MTKRLAVVLSLATFAGHALAAPAVEWTESHFLSNPRQLVFEGKRSGEGYFSPDGKHLIFQSERETENPFYQIYILNLGAGDTRRVSPGVGKTTCAFFRPGSDEVLFASSHHDPEALGKQKAELDFRASGKQRRYSWDYDDQMEIYSARRDGTRLKRLTDSIGYDAEAAYSPDGKRIVFTSLRNAFPLDKLPPDDRKRFETDAAYFGDIYIMNADGSAQRRLTESPGYDGGPFFSPDGKRIIWRRFDEKGETADVFTMRTDGTDVRRVTRFQCMAWAPFYHPSQKYVIFTANKHGFGNFELFLVDAAGDREPVRVTFTDGFDGLPVFSPDGTKLCWTSSRTADGKSQLFVSDWNHAHALAALGTGATPQTTTRSELKSSPAVRPPTKFSPKITAGELKTAVDYLASDALEGRETGARGSQLAADFIADRLKRAGVKPLGDAGGFFQKFDFSAGVRVLTNQNQLRIHRSGTNAGTAEFIAEKDFRPLAFTDNGHVEGDVVFAGYGLAVPGKPGEEYDSYANLDVTNKVVLVLRYVPEGVDAKRRQELNRYASLRYKAMIARERGAKALLVVTGPTSPNPGALAGLASDSSVAGSGIVGLSISTNVADALLASSGKTLHDLQTGLDSENPHAQGGMALAGVKASLTAAVERIRKNDRNVIGVLPPARGISEHVLVGAHYDHLGFGDSSSLERKGEEGQIHNGADDNASGVSIVLEIAEAMARERRKPRLGERGVIFALWSGEEMGLIGSAHFADKPPVPLSNIVACVNFDMVGRLRENKLVIQGAGSSSTWRKLIEKRNVAAGFNIVVQEDPYLPTDVTSFYPKQMPVLNFFTGSHDEYHRPTDDPSTLDYAGMERIAHFAHGLIADLAGAQPRPDYVKVERGSVGGSRDSLRAYLGTIPDYASEVSGVKLSGVRGGSPADKAGLKGGDIIVEFGGQKIANIYDYTYSLDAVKIGQPVKIAVTRDGTRIELTVVPEARK